MVKEFNECTIQSDEQVDTIIDFKEHVDGRNWLRNDSAEHVDVIIDSDKIGCGLTRSKKWSKGSYSHYQRNLSY